MKIDTAELLTTGWKLSEDAEALLEKRRKNRELLRLCAANGGMNAKETEELAELYPERKKGEDESELEPEQED